MFGSPSELLHLAAIRPTTTRLCCGCKSCSVRPAGGHGAIGGA